ncbi:hypothetical protein V5799_010371, partial [Amblyomma americanum]
MMSAKYDELLETQKRHDTEIQNLNKRLEVVELVGSEAEVGRLKRQINDLEQYGRRQNLEIHGLKYTENEKVLAVVNDLALSLSLEPVTESEIEGVHRLPQRKNEDKTPPVLIRFVSRKTKDQWLAKVKDLK